MKLSDIGSSVLLMIFGGGIVWLSRDLSIGVPRSPGPGFFPFCIGIALIGVALIILVQGLKHKGGSPQPVPEKSAKDYGKARVLSALAAIFIYSLIMEPLGYLVSTFLLMYFLLNLMARKTWWLGSLLACLITLISYIVFGVWLNILLPKGILVF